MKAILATLLALALAVPAAQAADASYLGGRTKLTAGTMHGTTNYFVVVTGGGTNASYANISPSNAFEVIKLLGSYTDPMAVSNSVAGLANAKAPTNNATLHGITVIRGSATMDAGNVGSLLVTNSVGKVVLHTTSTNLVVDLAGPGEIVLYMQTNPEAFVSTTGSWGTNATRFQLTIIDTNGTMTALTTFTNGLNGETPFVATNLVRNEFEFGWNGERGYFQARQSAATGSGSIVMNTNAQVYGQVNRFIPIQISGTGGANTNFALLSTQPEVVINGFTNVSLRAVMGYDVGLADYWVCSITNGSGSDRTLQFSAVTNSWRFAGTYGTNAPSVLTNNTKLLLSAQQQGSNVAIGYTYLAWP